MDFGEQRFLKGKIIKGKFIMENGRLFRDEVVGFWAGVMVVGVVAWWLMPGRSVWEVVRLMGYIFWLDIVVLTVSQVK